MSLGELHNLHFGDQIDIDRSLSKAVVPISVLKDLTSQGHRTCAFVGIEPTQQTERLMSCYQRFYI